MVAGCCRFEDTETGTSEVPIGRGRCRASIFPAERFPVPQRANVAGRRSFRLEGMRVFIRPDGQIGVIGVLSQGPMGEPMIVTHHASLHSPRGGRTQHRLCFRGMMVQTRERLTLPD